MTRKLKSAVFLWACVGMSSACSFALADDAMFVEHVAPLLKEKCLSCHNDRDKKGGLSLSDAQSALEGESGPSWVAGDADSSHLIELITPEDGKAEMPEGLPPLTEKEQAVFREWIQQGAKWPSDLKIEPEKWWSFRGVKSHKTSALPQEFASWCRTPIDRFIAAKLVEHALAPAPEADRRTLVRRLYFNLTGLPPSPEDVESFVNDRHPLAYENLVDRLLASPQYGEKWARHWLDIVHFGETHGYDKDKPRPNAWPYRDYVIRSFNRDKPFQQFIEEQIAGDVLYPSSRDGIEALGFIAAGPWDFIGHAEVPETKIDGRIARHLDRDDMVQNTITSFMSLTVGCAQCHDHKFDPIPQQDYYSLHAVFAALDRADREYYADPKLTKLRSEHLSRQRGLEIQLRELEDEIKEKGGTELDSLRSKIDEAQRKPGKRPEEHGYHSQIESKNDRAKWVQIDLGQPNAIKSISYIASHDDFGGIGAGFGFPLRYKIEASNAPKFDENVQVLVSHLDKDVKNPGTTIQSATVDMKARYVRFTATKLAKRANDYIFALAELEVLDAKGNNVAKGKTVSALDSIEAPVRWQRSNLVDGRFPNRGTPKSEIELAAMIKQRDRLLGERVGTELMSSVRKVRENLKTVQSSLQQMPTPQRVYAGTIHNGSGAFRGTAHNGGKPREIRVLPRGDVRNPGAPVHPGSLTCIDIIPAKFEIAPDAPEGERRAALARWVSHRKNPLTWRSIANRIWQYHFGRGIVDSPGDFGRNGQKPTHPELLDWLALELRDNGGSLKQLHRLIVTSSVYRQSSRSNGTTEFASRELARFAETKKSSPFEVDPQNRLLWRMSRRRLEAEAIRDAMLVVSGQINYHMGGASFKDFIIEKPEHSPHYQYHLHDPEDHKAHRRSVYRFLVRSKTQPFMTVMDCADPSMMVDKRNQTITPLQALSMLNNKLAVVLAEHFANRVEFSVTPQVRAESSNANEQGAVGPDGAQQLSEKVEFAFRLALGRPPTNDELRVLRDYAAQHGLANACRAIINLNEFVFVD